MVIALAERKSSEKEAATKVLRADEDRILAVIDVVVEVLTRTKTSSMVCECRSWHTGHAEVDDKAAKHFPGFWANTAHFATFVPGFWAK